MTSRQNLRRRFTPAIMVTAASLLVAQTPPTGPTTGYAPVNGLEMYYEIHGSGETLILLHGGVVGITMFDPNLDTLAQKRKVIAVELQGHGHTADIDRPLSFESMADDVAALMRYLKIDKADVMGYSLGGGVTLQLAFRHPELVRKLIIVSEPFSQDGWYPEVVAAFKQMGPAAAAPMKSSPLAKLYPNVNWETLFTKLGALQSKSYDWSREVSGIQALTMLVLADADAVRPGHMVKFFELLGAGNGMRDWTAREDP